MQADGTTQIYGREIAPIGTAGRSVMQGPETAAVGFTVIRVGHEREIAADWVQTEHLLLTPTETAGLLDELAHQCAGAAALEAPGIGERAPKVAELVERLTERTLEALRAAPAIPSGATGLLTLAEIAAAERAVALQLLSGRRGLYVGGVTR